MHTIEEFALLLYFMSEFSKYFIFSNLFYYLLRKRVGIKQNRVCILSEKVFKKSE